MINRDSVSTLNSELFPRNPSTSLLLEDQKEQENPLKRPIKSSNYMAIMRNDSIRESSFEEDEDSDDDLQYRPVWRTFNIRMFAILYYSVPYGVLVILLVFESYKYID